MASEVKEHKYVSNELSDLSSVAASLLHDAGANRVFAFYGNMGAGKTTLIKEICKQIGVTDHTTSPTFTIVNEYLTQNGQTVYHFDFYRIKNETEAFDLGFENYLYSGNYCFIEWPEKVKTLLPQEIAVITIATEGEKRILTMSL